MRSPVLHIAVFFVLLATAGCAKGWQQEIKGNPGDYHYQMGLSYLGERNYTGALIELTEAEKFSPDNPDMLYSLARAYMGKKRYDLAEKKLEQAIMLKQNFSTARNDLGIVFLELKRWDNAIQQFKIAKDDLFYGDSENAAINLGLAYLGKGDYPKALEELQAVIVTNPGNPFARLTFGRIWFAMDKTEQAVVEYRKALDIYKEYGAAYYYLGLAQLKLNNLDAAKSSFKEVLRIIPDSELGHSTLGYLELLK
jgi:type IV pilus assembly protein PilF